MNTNIKIEPRKILSQLKGNVSLMLGIGLVLVIFLAILAVRHSLNIVLSANAVALNPQSQLSRINFELYDKISERFNDAANREPSPVTVRSPFGVRIIVDE